MMQNLTPSHFESIVRKGYSLDMVYLLILIKSDYDIQPLLLSARVDLIRIALLRKGLITEDYKLTTVAEDILNFTQSDQLILKIRKPDEEAFERWWKAFPGTDTFSINGIDFTGSRAMKMKKPECKIKFDKIVSEGEFTPDQLIEAMIFDVDQKKQASYKQRINKLTFLQNSLTYLNQRSYEPFIDLIKTMDKKPASKHSVIKGIDI